MFPFSIQKEKAFRVSAGIGPIPECLVSHHEIPAQTLFSKNAKDQTLLSVATVSDDRAKLP